MHALSTDLLICSVLFKTYPTYTIIEVWYRIWGLISLKVLSFWSHTLCLRILPLFINFLKALFRMAPSIFFWMIMTLNWCSFHGLFELQKQMIDFEGVTHHEYALQEQTIQQEFYNEVLRYLHEAVQRIQSQKWEPSNWMCHHNNAPSHSLQLFQQFFAKNATPKYSSL